MLPYAKPTTVVLLNALLLCCLFGCMPPEPTYDLILRNGNVYTGNNAKPFLADVAINADTIAFIGSLTHVKAKNEIDITGMAVAPGFINMLSWATETLLEDGRSQSDIRQGVTLEVMGEGWSMGPLNNKLRRQMLQEQQDIKFEIPWTTLGEYLQHLETKGVSTNVASFVGATTLRMHVMGEDNRDPSPAELEKMQNLVRQAMEEGALGIGTSLIYPPAFFAKTDELIALCKAAAPYGGSYISHLRSEGNRIHEAIDELITISREANIPAEIYHLKMAGKQNWHKLDSVVRQIEAARSSGLHVRTNMYTYTAGATGLTAAFPPSLQDGGFGKLWKKLNDKKIRGEMAEAMQTDAEEWENLYFGAGPNGTLLLGFRQDSLRKFIGKTLQEVADMRGSTVEETAMDLIVQDSSRVEVAYFLMSEENVKAQIKLPWMSFGSDAGSYTNEGIFLKQSTHPRAYGNFARLLGKYVREEKVIPLHEAIYKLTKLPATNLNLEKRGELKPGFYADIVVFDPKTISDSATYDMPHQYATGVIHVWVNGTQVLSKGEHTGATPGRFVKGPGAKKTGSNPLP